MDLKAAHARALADLEEADALEKMAVEALVQARVRVGELRTMVDALNRAMELYERPVLVVEGVTEVEALARTGGVPATIVTANGSPDLRLILQSDESPSITNLAFGALRHLSRPASTQEVREIIAEVGGRSCNNGKDFNQEQVRSALAWLMKSERIVRVAPGTWMIPKAAEPQDDFTPADESAGVSETSGSLSAKDALSLERT